MVTDDRPSSEYFLLRRLAGTHSPIAVPSTAQGSGRFRVADPVADGATVRGSARRRVLSRVGLAAGAASSRSTSGCGARLIATGGSDGADYTAFYTGWTIVAEGRRPEPLRPRRPDRGPTTDPRWALVRSGAQPVQQPALFGPAVRAAGGAPAGDLVCRLGRDPGRPARGLMWRLLTKVAVGWSSEERVLLPARRSQRRRWRWRCSRVRSRCSSRSRCWRSTWHFGPAATGPPPRGSWSRRSSRRPS